MHFRPEVIEIFLDAISKGASIAIAADTVGMHESLFYKWQQRALETEDENDPYFKFLEAYKKARGKRAVKWLEIIDKAMNEHNWQAAAWKLERVHPETYSRDASQLKEIMEIVNYFKQKESNNGKDQSKADAELRGQGTDIPESKL